MNKALEVFNCKTILRIVLMLLSLVLLPALLIFTRTALAQKGAYHLPPNVKQYFTDKYQNTRDITSRLQETPNGPHGSLHIGLNYLPISAPVAAGGDRNSRSLAIAKLFLEGEAALLGINNIEELRTTGPQTRRGFGGEYSKIYYYRYINNIKIENYEINITVGPEETITSLSAYLVPTPPELYEAAAKETLKENKLLSIVERDLKTAGFHAKKLELKHGRRAAIHTPPYLVWNVYAFAALDGGRGSWEYIIDAFTGEVIKRMHGGSN